MILMSLTTQMTCMQLWHSSLVWGTSFAYVPAEDLECVTVDIDTAVLESDVPKGIETYFVQPRIYMFGEVR